MRGSVTFNVSDEELLRPLEARVGRSPRVIVLDTHAWLCWVAEPARLSEPAREAIDRSSELGVSTLSAWEITVLAAHGRITLDHDVGLWVVQASRTSASSHWHPAQTLRCRPACSTPGPSPALRSTA
jgi:hypothetical protein